MHAAPIKLLLPQPFISLSEFLLRTAAVEVIPEAVAYLRSQEWNVARSIVWAMHLGNCFGAYELCNSYHRGGDLRFISSRTAKRQIKLRIFPHEAKEKSNPTVGILFWYSFCQVHMLLKIVGSWIEWSWSSIWNALQRSMEKQFLNTRSRKISWQPQRMDFYQYGASNTTLIDQSNEEYILGRFQSVFCHKNLFASSDGWHFVLISSTY